MRICNIRIQKTETEAVLLGDCCTAEKTHELFYATTHEFGQYLDEHSADAFVLAALVPAMKTGENLQVEWPMSSKLHYHLATYLIPWLARVNSELKPISILPSAGYNDTEYDASAVVTGISCGIDSFFTIFSHLQKETPQSARLSHVVLNCHQKEPTFAAAKEQLGICCKDQERLEVGKKLGVTPIYVWTNVNQFIDLPFEQICTFHDLSVGMSLKKLVKTYYYASSYTIDYFHPTFAAAPMYDVLNALAIQTESFQMLTHAIHEERVEKTAFVAKQPLAQNYLDVCFHKEQRGCKKNCTQCEKCLRTAVTLYGLGKLDDFKAVFDTEYFYRHLDRIIGGVMYRAFINKNEYDIHIVNLLRQKKIPLPTVSYTWMVQEGIHNQLDKIRIKRPAAKMASD